MFTNSQIGAAMTIRLDDALPQYMGLDPKYRRAPDRGFRLSPAQAKLALKNALRYVPEALHETLAPEFMEELVTRGRMPLWFYQVKIPLLPVVGRHTLLIYMLHQPVVLFVLYIVLGGRTI